jgi:hypothetical protein
MAGQVRPRRRGLVALSVVTGVLAVAWLGTWQRLTPTAASSASSWPRVGPADGSAALQVRQADVSAAITVLARRIVLDGTSLQPAQLAGARLVRAC